MDGEDGGRLVVMGRAEIDTRAPFKSVREAVMLFGERVLVGEIYASKIKEIKAAGSEGGESQARAGSLTAELEGTRQSLQKAKEENNILAYCIQSLTHELQQTKKQLQQFKATEEYGKPEPAPVTAPEIEDLKFVENETGRDQKEENISTVQKKRYVKFASPPELDRIIVSREELLAQRSPPSITKLKKKPLVPLIGWLFAKKK